MTRVARVAAFLLPGVLGWLVYDWVSASARPAEGLGQEWQMQLLVAAPMVTAAVSGILSGDRLRGFITGALAPAAVTTALIAALGTADPGTAATAVMYPIVGGLVAGVVGAAASNLQKPAYRLLTGKR